MAKQTLAREWGDAGQTGNATGQPLLDAHLHFELRSEPLPGLGLQGRLDPNVIFDTKFYSQDPTKNQTTTGVVKKCPTGDIIKQYRNGKETPIYTPNKSRKSTDPIETLIDNCTSG